MRAVVVVSTGLLGAIAIAVMAAGHPSAAGQAGPPAPVSKPAAQAGGFAVQLPAVVNALQRATIDVRRDVTRHLGLGGAYWYDKYSVNDFALGAETLTTLAQPSFLMLGYR